MTKRKNNKVQPEPSGFETAVEELTADLQRVQADFVNFRRRAQESEAEARMSGKRGVIIKLLPIIDNLQRGLKHQPKELRKNQWAKGVNKVAEQLESTLENLGVKKIDALGKEFNPNLHEAVQMEQGEGDGEIVCEELQAGYKLDNEVIRPSMVKVKKGKL